MNCGASISPDYRQNGEYMSSKHKRKQHISVTIDLLRTFPDLDVTKETDLNLALYRVGFDVMRNDAGKVTGLKPYTMMTKNVRCANLPYTYRKTLIFAGDMRPDFKFAQIYNGIDILDVGVYSERDMELVDDLPYDLPVSEKVNTRKYTKRGDREESVEIAYTIDDESHLGDIFGLGE